MFPRVTEDTGFVRRYSEEDGKADTDIEVSHPIFPCVCCRKDMIHAIGREVIDGLLGDGIEVFVGTRTYIEHTEVHESGKAKSAVEAVTRCGTIYTSVIERGIFVSGFHMRQDIELETQSFSRSFEWHIIAISVIIHLMPNAQEGFVQGFGGSVECLSGVPFERAVDVETGKPIADAGCTEQVLTATYKGTCT